jgi:dTDP-glucose 4,6-dehydratase
MRIAITGEDGFIAKNLIKEISEFDHSFISLKKNAYFLSSRRDETNEPCVHSNSEENWYRTFTTLDIDVIVHNAAVVGTDVVALNGKDSNLTNIYGTQVITNAANRAGILNIYIGTSVIYDTKMYQSKEITEDSVIFPRTLYAIQKHAGEMIVRNTSKNYLVIRPLFAYGGEGDMNSLIAKSMFAIKNNIKSVDMFLDPEKIKDYMHVTDFCNAIMTAISSNIRNKEYNVSANNPHKTLEIVEKIQRHTKSDLSSILKWHNETDYLGNHRLSSEKFRKDFDWANEISFDEGIKMSWDSIESAKSSYNPLKYLNQAKDSNINLKEFFPKQ